MEAAFTLFFFLNPALGWAEYSNFIQFIQSAANFHSYPSKTLLLLLDIMNENSFVEKLGITDHTPQQGGEKLTILSLQSNCSKYLGMPISDLLLTFK